MRNKGRFFLTVACFIILFDVVASFASRSLRFNYGNLVWASWFLYLVSGYVGCMYYDFRAGVVAGLIAGLSDSTVGWALSSFIGPYTTRPHPSPSSLTISLVIVIVTTKGVLLGLVGALLCKIARRKWPATHG
jgi:hypothetical protein